MRQSTLKCSFVQYLYVCITLCTACFSCYIAILDLVELLLANGADISVTTKCGNSVMHGAMNSNNVALVNTLILAGGLFMHCACL